MSKITSYARQQHHGVSNLLSGAIVPVSNDHTDGSWTITDIYDRELMINTGNGNLQYRAGNTIFNPVVSSGSTIIKQVVYQIGNWSMESLGLDFVSISADELTNKKIISINAVIIPDSAATYSADVFNYDFVSATGPSLTPLRIFISLLIGGPTLIILEIPNTGDNWFRLVSDTAPPAFNSSSQNRGYVTIQYMD